MNNSTENENKEHKYFFGEAKMSPIPLTVNSPQIRPEDKNKIRSIALESMELQAQQQLDMLKRQAQTIMEEIKNIENRVQVSYQIYQAEMKFTPVHGKTYYLYQKEDKMCMSLISPDEWGDKMPYDQFKAAVKLLSDHTWEILNK